MCAQKKKTSDQGSNLDLLSTSQMRQTYMYALTAELLEVEKRMLLYTSVVVQVDFVLELKACTTCKGGCKYMYMRG